MLGKRVPRPRHAGSSAGQSHTTHGELPRPDALCACVTKDVASAVTSPQRAQPEASDSRAGRVSVWIPGSFRSSLWGSLAGRLLAIFKAFGSQFLHL